MRDPTNPTSWSFVPRIYRPSGRRRASGARFDCASVALAQRWSRASGQSFMTLVSPVLFSQRFNVSPTALEAAGLLDPFLNSDTKLFIDPLLLEKSQHPAIKARGLAVLRTGFGQVIDLVEASQRPGDPAWKAAVRLLNLEETAETCLGYGGASISGASRPDSLRQSILATAKEIIQLGDKNPNL